MITTNTVTHIIYGSANKGKTSTIRGITQYLLNTGGVVFCPTPFTIPTNDDFECIIEHVDKNGAKIIYAIISAGDDQYLQSRWTKLDQGYFGNVDIIIGASRTKGVTIDFWTNPVTNTIANPLSTHTIMLSNLKWFQSNYDRETYHHLYTDLKIDIFKLMLNI